MPRRSLAALHGRHPRSQKRCSRRFRQVKVETITRKASRNSCRAFRPHPSRKRRQFVRLQLQPCAGGRYYPSRPRLSVGAVGVQFDHLTAKDLNPGSTHLRIARQFYGHRLPVSTGTSLGNIQPDPYSQSICPDSRQVRSVSAQSGGRSSSRQRRNSLQLPTLTDPRGWKLTCRALYRLTM
jgi:hypothetical protein